jgi:hypothetical protein
MASKMGCFRPVLLGCIGLVFVVALGLAIMSIFALRGVQKERVEDRLLAGTHEVEAASGGEGGDELTLPPGRVVLELSQGEFHLRPGEPGEGVRVAARFDQESYELNDSLENLADGTWIYRVRFRRTIPAFQAILQAIFGGNQETRVDVYLPPDAPLALELQVTEGASEIELGGLWLTEAHLAARKGGFSLEISEPLRAPLEAMTLEGGMGGLAAAGLGNASPRRLDVAWRMGGANLDLSGAWARDSDISLSIDMGGMSAVVPREVELDLDHGDPAPLRTPPRENSIPVLRVVTEAKRGEIDVVRR